MCVCVCVCVCVCMWWGSYLTSSGVSAMLVILNSQIMAQILSLIEKIFWIEFNNTQNTSEKRYNPLSLL